MLLSPKGPYCRCGKEVYPGFCKPVLESQRHVSTPLPGNSQLTLEEIMFEVWTAML